MISVEDAQEKILEMVDPLPALQVELEASLGYVLSDDAKSDIDIAPFANTAMDGFALLSSDVSKASEANPILLEIIAHVGAGSHFEGTVMPGQAVRIMTGAPIPRGCDAVEKIEVVTFEGDGLVGDRVSLTAPVSRGNNIREAGEEAQAGDVVLEAGTTINPATVGLLASIGHAVVSVHDRPRVGVISLGSELVDVSELPGPGKIRESNSYMLAAMALEAGCEVRRYGVVVDDEEQIEQQLSIAIDECDFVISSGGASAGDFDYITQIAERLGEVFYKYVNMRPGKSQTFALIRNTPFVGLAGNPAAAAVGFEILVRPALMKMQGKTDLMRPVQHAVMGVPLKKKDSRRNYLRGSVGPDGEGGYVAYPASNQSSALLGELSKGNCLIIVSEELRSAPMGTPVTCLRIDVPAGTEL